MDRIRQEVKLKTSCFKIKNYLFDATQHLVIKFTLYKIIGAD